MKLHEGSRQQLALAGVLGALVAQEKLSPAERMRALRAFSEAKPDDKHLLTRLGELGLKRGDAQDSTWTTEALATWVAAQADLPYMRIDPLKIDVNAVTAVVPYAYARRAGILPVEVTPEQITVATAEPWQRDWEADLVKISGRSIRRKIASPADIDRYQVELYSLSRSVQASEAERSGARQPGALNSLEQLMELGRKGGLDANDQHVVNIVDWLLQYAFEQRASDIHMEPRRDFGRVRLRIDGVLHEVYQLPAPVMGAVTSRIKILGRMNVAEKRRPQDGRIKTRTPEGREIELRLSTMPTAFGEKLVLRVFDPEVLVQDFSGLGLVGYDREQWEQMIQSPYGIILVTGPTGSGKTTTLYSTLKQLARPEVNVCTIEDPIELIEPSLNQMQVQSNIDVTFANGVRTVLRQDPDIIMIGEIRDLETAEIAIQAALTGHLVLSTLHTNDAPSAITRLLELGVPPYLLRATLLGAVAQRLVRKLCPHCKAEVQTPPDTWALLTADQRADAPEHLCEPVGCLECRETGYRGRQGIFETLVMSDAVQAQLNEQTNLAALRQQALKDGMQTLRSSGAQAVAAGITSAQEVLKVTPISRY